MRNTESATSARRAQGEESRERLIQAAIETISERGYAATSVGDICRRAGVAKTALYWHFKSKEGLLATVVERVGDSWIEELQKQVYLKGTALDRLNGLFEAWREVLRSQPNLIRLPMMVKVGVGDNSDAIQVALEHFLEHARDALIQGIEDSLGTGLKDLDLVAHTILTLLEGVLLYQVHHPDDDEQLDRIFEEFRRTTILVLWDRLPPEERNRLSEAFEPGRADPD